MHDLTTVGGILTYLKGTRFAATKVYPLSGGNSAFIYRILLENPLPSGESIIIKHFEDYISGYISTKLNVKRAVCAATVTDTTLLIYLVGRVRCSSTRR